jgi:hypothetical protein
VRGFSDRFADTVSKSHTAVATVEVLDEHGNVIAELVPHAGMVKADRTQAQMRDMEIEISDPNMIPEDMTSLLSPGTRIRVRRGARLEDVDLRVQVANSATSWMVIGTGVLNSVEVDGNGALTLHG